MVLKHQKCHLWTAVTIIHCNNDAMQFSSFNTVARGYSLTQLDNWSEHVIHKNNIDINKHWLIHTSSRYRATLVQMRSHVSDHQTYNFEATLLPYQCTSKGKNEVQLHISKMYLFDINWLRKPWPRRTGNFWFLYLQNQFSLIHNLP